MIYKGRTDIATESFRQLDGSAGELTEKQGVIAVQEHLHGLELMAVDILNETGAQALGKPIGKYFTLDLPQRFERGAEQFEAAARAVALRDCRRALLADFPDAEILREQRTVTVQNGTAHAEVRYLFTADIAQAAQD